MHNGTKRAGACVLAIALAVGLSGCKNPLETLVENVIEDAIGGQIGGDVDVDGGNVSFDTDDGHVQLGEGSTLPASFPSRLPVPNGTLQAALEGTDQWTLSYTDVDRFEFDKLVVVLKATGFTEEALFDNDEMFQGSFTDDQYTVTLVWGNSADSSHLIYGVTPAG